MPVMHELVASAEREIHLLAYVFTRAAAPLLTQVETALARGLRVTIVVNVIPGQNIEMQAELDVMRRAYAHTATIKCFAPDDGSQLHAKVLVADRERAVIGSANYSWGGLVANHEVGVLVEGRPAWELARMTDRLALQSSELG
jgi:cardiolipin synthase